MNQSNEPNWEEIAIQLMHRLSFAMTHGKFGDLWRRELETLRVDGGYTNSFLREQFEGWCLAKSAALSQNVPVSLLPEAALSDRTICGIAEEFYTAEMLCGEICIDFDEVGFARAIIAELRGDSK